MVPCVASPRPPASGADQARYYCLAMTRLPYLRYDDLDEAGREVWESVTGSRGGDLVNDSGGLIGPFNAFVHAPGVGRHLSRLGGRLRFRTSIERRLSELAIITVAARWKAEFEWWAHARMAREHGVPGPAVEAIGRGDEPAFEAGDEGMVELVALCGYYTLISYLLNAFAVPLPPEVAAQWPDGHPTSR